MVGLRISLVLLAIALGLTATAVTATESDSAPPATPSELRAALIRDMTLRSERLPAGLPPASYAVQPRIGAGNHPGDFTAFTAWGQLFPCAGGDADASGRVEIRGIQGWILSRQTHRWKRVQSSLTVDGNAFRVPYVHNESGPADVVRLKDGGLSVQAKRGTAYIFWPASYAGNSHKVTIDPHDILGVATIIHARLAPTGSALDASACYVLSAGADYWLSVETPWDYERTNTDAGIGRFKTITRRWRLYTMTTASPRNLGRYPLPVGARVDELESASTT